jgi:hypothetical protein
VYGAFVLDVAGVQGRGGFKQYDPAFLFSYRAVFNSARHYDKLAFLDPFLAVAEIHAEAAFDYQEHFIFVLVMMEYERAVEFDELHLLAVEFGGDAGVVVVVNLGELFGDVDFGHGILGGWYLPRSYWMTHFACGSQENQLTAEKAAKQKQKPPVFADG